MSIFRKLRPIGVLLILAISGGTAGTTLAFSRGGYPPDFPTDPPFVKCGPGIEYRFLNTPTHDWTETERTWARQGLLVWEAVLDRDASQIIDLEETTGTTIINVKWVDSLPYGGLAASNCDAQPTDGYIKLSFADLHPLGLSIIRATVTHELGHVLGFAHTGRDDNTPQDSDDVIPTMAGDCFTSSSELIEQYTLTRDDRAALLQRHGSAGYPEMVSDPSFEMNSGSWRVDDGTLQRNDGWNDPWGNWHARFIGSEPVSGEDPVLNQTSTIYRTGTVDGAAYVRKLDSGHRGSVWLTIKGRTLEPDYYYGLETSCDWTFGDWYGVVQTRIEPTPNWEQYETTTFAYTPIPSSSGTLVRINVRSGLNGCPASDPCRVEAAVEDVRIRAR